MIFSPRPRLNNASRPAFTLTEILVVIGIVMLLAAILFPIITKVKETGRQTTCASNLRQIGLALQSYLQDSRGIYPSTEIYVDNCIWAHRLLPYTKSPTIFECPSYPQGPFNPACSEPDLSGDAPQWFNGGYQWNSTRPPAALTLSQNIIRQPSDMVIICDGDATHYAQMTPVSVSATIVSELKNNGLRARHGQGVNALYADSHVKWLSLEQLLNKDIWKYR